MIELFDRLWSASVAFHNAGGVINMFFSIALQIAASWYLAALYFVPIVIVIVIVFFLFKRLNYNQVILGKEETDEHTT